MSTETRTCSGCDREFPADLWRRRRWGRVCNACFKREWRRTNGAAVERDRETSRRWKRIHRGKSSVPSGGADKIHGSTQIAPRDAGTSGGLAPNNGGSMQGQRYTQPGNSGGRDG